MKSSYFYFSAKAPADRGIRVSRLDSARTEWIQNPEAMFSHLQYGKPSVSVEILRLPLSPIALRKWYAAISCKNYADSTSRDGPPTIVVKMRGTLCLLCRIPAIFVPSPPPPLPPPPSPLPPMECWTTARKPFLSDNLAWGEGGGGRIWPKERLFENVKMWKMWKCEKRSMVEALHNYAICVFLLLLIRANQNRG